MSLLCIVFLLDFAAISDIYGEEEGEILLLSVAMETTYYIARSAFHSVIFNRQGFFFVSVCLQRRELNNHWPPFKTVRSLSDKCHFMWKKSVSYISLSARRAGILKNFSNLPLWSNTLIVKSQPTAIFCPLELVTIWHGSFISSTPLHHPDQVSMIQYDAPYPVYAAPKLSLRHAASQLSPLLYQLWAIPGAVNSNCI